MIQILESMIMQREIILKLVEITWVSTIVCPMLELEGRMTSQLNSVHQAKMGAEYEHKNQV